MVAVAAVFRQVLYGALEVAEADARLAALCEGTGLANGFYHGTAGYRRIAMAAPA